MNKAFKTCYRLIYILGLAFLLSSFVMVWPIQGNVSPVNAYGANAPQRETPTPTPDPPTDTPTRPPPTDTPTEPPTDTPTEPPPTDTPTEPPTDTPTEPPPTGTPTEPPTDTPTEPPPTDTPTPPTDTPTPKSVTDINAPTPTEIPTDTPRPTETATQPTITATGGVVALVHRSPRDDGRGSLPCSRHNQVTDKIAAIREPGDRRPRDARRSTGDGDHHRLPGCRRIADHG